MSKETHKICKDGFPVSKDEPKSKDLKPSNINPPTPREKPDNNQKKP